MKNDGDPRQAVTPLASLWSAKKVNPANSHSTATGADPDATRTRRSPGSPSSRERGTAPTRRLGTAPRPSATRSSGPPKRWDDDLPGHDGDPRRRAERPVRRVAGPVEVQEREQGQAAAAERHDRDRAQGGGARRQRDRGDADDGSLARIDRVSQNVAIMPKPPRKIAVNAFTRPMSATAVPRPAHVHHAVITTANRKTGLMANRRVSRAASAVKMARPGGCGRPERERRGHDATSAAGSSSADPPRSSR